MKDNFWYKDNTNVTCLLGRRGQGKTLMLCYLAVEEWQKANKKGYHDFHIYHNGFINNKADIFKINGKHTGRIIDIGLMDIIETVQTGKSKLENGLLLIDEVTSIGDNRYGASSYGGVLFSHYILMIRKRGMSCLYATQFEHSIDRRLKEQTDIVGYCVSAPKDKGKQVGVTYVHQGTFGPEGQKKKKLYTNMQRMWNVYDTYKMIQSEQLGKDEILKRSTEEEEDAVFKHLDGYVKKKKQWQLSMMEIKAMIAKDLSVYWDIDKIRKFLVNVAVQDKKEKMYWNFYNYSLDPV